MDRLRIVGDKALSASLTDGSDISVDFVIVGIGIIPNTELAKSAKLKINNGIFVNDECRTSISNIYAAGDCTSFEYKNTLVRLESVGNAIDQANTVAQNILQQNTKYKGSVLGDAGKHARVAVSANSLPLGVAVAIDGIFQIA